MTISTFTERSRAVLSTLYPTSEALTLTRHLLLERLGYSIAYIMIHQDEVINPDFELQLLSDIERLGNAEPLQYVLGYAWFSELKIGVDQHVLIPRPETEELVQFIRDEKFAANANMLDICTGSGCIALALKHSFPEVNITGCDVSFEALLKAKNNAKDLNLNVNWVWVDVLDNQWGQIEETQFELIVSNPPYILKSEADEMHENVLQYEPHIALFVEDDDPLIFYKRIASFAYKNLKSNGQLWFEINEKQGENVAELLENLHFHDVRIYHDLSGKDRFVYAEKK